MSLCRTYQHFQLLHSLFAKSMTQIIACKASWSESWSSLLAGRPARVALLEHMGLAAYSHSEVLVVIRVDIPITLIGAC